MINTSFYATWSPRLLSVMRMVIAFKCLVMPPTSPFERKKCKVAGLRAASRAG
jgi:hypothetical protein